jgi:epoxyqueuosine reductase
MTHNIPAEAPASLEQGKTPPFFSEAIKAEAHRLGFALAGITTPDPPPHIPAYESWLEAGRHGEMGYLAAEDARHARANPRQILPACRSILVLGMRYAANPLKETTSSNAPGALPGDEPGGRIASYAWGDDYHEILPARLRSLVSFIEDAVGSAVPNRWYTDAGPILERDLAQRAGLGWIGKNTCLINPRQGSYFLLAEILLGLELAADMPFGQDHCGSCTRCLDACPTACILPDRTLDARRCISYLTIELKGAIPLELRPQMGNWVFGCDICQQVCPWNRRFAAMGGDTLDAAFLPRPGLPKPDLNAGLGLTREAFNEKFRGSALKRTRRRGYLRNIAVALGNAGAPAGLTALSNALAHDPEPLVRGHAAWALGRIRGIAAQQALDTARLQESDPMVLAEIMAAQGRHA